MLHSLHGTHTAVGLELPTLKDNGFPWGFFDTRQERTKHHTVSPCGNGLYDIPCIADTPVGNYRNL